MDRLEELLLLKAVGTAHTSRHTMNWVMRQQMALLQHKIHKLVPASTGLIKWVAINIGLGTLLNSLHIIS